MRINEVAESNLGEALQEPNRLSAVMCPEPIGESATWQGSRRLPQSSKTCRKLCCCRSFFLFSIIQFLRKGGGFNKLFLQILDYPVLV
jgi:hypothetical protein